jgi:alkyldihydroxyacetonephosphate synthase
VIPDVARLSDEHETRLSLTLSDDGSLKRRAGRRYVGVRGYDGGCIAILGWEGERRDVDARRALTKRILSRAGGLSLGTGPGRAWAHGRYDGPYLRDALLDRAVMAETLETAAPWSGLMRLYAAVGDAIRAALAGQGTPGLVMCHVSHLYPDGASLYYTFIAPQREGEEHEQWRAVKSAACDAIVTNGGTLTHHHAVGRDHAPWMAREIGETAVEALRAVKERVDPAGILNPGKLLP